MKSFGNVNCPFCKVRNSGVYATRYRQTDSRARYHRCVACGKSFKTIEFVPTVTRLKALFAKFKISTRESS